MIITNRMLAEMETEVAF